MIRNIIATAAVALCAYAATAQSLGGSVNTSDTTDTVAVGVDTLLTIDDNAVDSLDVKTADTKPGKDAIDMDDEELLQAALSVDSIKVSSSAQKLDLIRREYEYKKQTKAAIIMMIFIAAAMATSQSWNPR